jgi:protocatechuate 3,4-dioxygenase, beta subunit
MDSQSSKTRRDVLTAAIATGVASIASVPAAVAETIRRTPSQIVGPFYPLTKPLDQDADLTAIAGKSGRALGQVIYLSGRVLNSKGEPVPNAGIEIWQANAHGKYTHPSDTNPAPLDPNFEGYARLTTDADGRYAIKTIKPGGYPEDVSGRMRAPHIHFDVSGRVNRLVTQLYFAGDPLNDTDRFMATALSNKERLIIKPEPSSADKDAGSLSATWDIVLNDG